eukprot:GEMP01097261.1.p1 GENE.GEMP01097261.1~~GEMP01097261.1.p1  ORF type:complete len:134 (+),score=21.68 GEMP01097261.1:172-573(+)
MSMEYGFERNSNTRFYRPLYTMPPTPPSTANSMSSRRASSCGSASLPKGNGIRMRTTVPYGTAFQAGRTRSLPQLTGCVMMRGTDLRQPAHPSNNRWLQKPIYAAGDTSRLQQHGFAAYFAYTTGPHAPGYRH